jgi:hypothetical protein
MDDAERVSSKAQATQRAGDASSTPSSTASAPLSVPPSVPPSAPPSAPPSVPHRASVSSSAERTARAGHSGALVLLAIILFALVLRFVGIRHLLPHQADADGNVFVTQMELFQRGVPHPEREFLFGFYPTLIARLASAAPLASPDVLAQSAPSTLDAQLAAASTEYLHLRCVVAILSVLLVPGTWLLARRFAGPGAALCAAALAATSLLHLWFAQQARPHAASTAFALLGVLAALSLRRRGRPIDYIATGLALGLAVGSLQSGIAVILPIAAAVVLRSADAKRTSLAWVFALIALAIVFVLLFYPFLLARSDAKGGVRLDVDERGVDLWGHIINPKSFNGEGLARVWHALSGYDTWISALAVVGGTLAILHWSRSVRDNERARDLAVVLAYAIPYLVAICLYARTYQRFVIPLVPYLACLGGYAIARIAVLASTLRAPRGEPRAALGAIVALALLAPQFIVSLRLVAARSAPDTARLAADWVSRNVQPNSEKVLVQYPLELPLPSTSASLADDDGGMMSDAKHPWLLYQRALPATRRLQPEWNLVIMPMRTEVERARIQQDPVGYLKLLGGDYAVIDVYEGGRPPTVLNFIRPALIAIGVRVARFSPDGVDEGSNLPIMYQDDEYPTPTNWFARILGARCTGPVIEIYKLR